MFRIQATIMLTNASSRQHGVTLRPQGNSLNITVICIVPRSLKWVPNWIWSHLHQLFPIKVNIQISSLAINIIQLSRHVIDLLYSYLYRMQQHNFLFYNAWQLDSKWLSNYEILKYLENTVSRYHLALE